MTRQIERAIKASTNETNQTVSICSDSSEAATSVSKSTGAEESKDGDFVPDKTADSSDESEEENYSEENEDSDFTMSPQPTKTKKKAKDNVKLTPKAKQTKAKKPVTSDKSTNAQVNKERSSNESLPAENTEPVVKKATHIKTKVQKSSPLVAKTSLSNAKTRAAPSGTASSRTGSPVVLGVNKRSINWTPPSRVGDGRSKSDSCTPKPVRVQSSGGGTPVIRVGLSRNARVKSLHSNIKT